MWVIWVSACMVDPCERCPSWATRSSARPPLYRGRRIININARQYFCRLAPPLALPASRLLLAAQLNAQPHRVAFASIRGLIPLDNLDMPCHCHKTFKHPPDGDIVERAAANREGFRHRNCCATG